MTTVKHTRQFLSSFLAIAGMLCCFACCPQWSVAGTPPVNVAGFNSYTSDPKAEGDFQTLVIPFKRADGLLLVEANIDSVEGNFILDTGAPYLVLNKTYFRNGKQTEGSLSAGVTGGASAVLHTTVGKLQIQELFYRNVQADVVSLGHIEDDKGIKIFGMLGANLFMDMEMEIDVRNSVIYLYKLNKNGDRLDVSSNHSNAAPGLQIPIEVQNSIIFVNASVGKNKLRFCLDTGAEVSVLSNNVSNKVLETFHLVSRNTLMGSGNKKVEVLGGQLDELTIGNHVFTDLQAILTGLGGLESVYNTSLQGILGFNFLDQGRVLINFRKKQLTMYFYNAEIIEKAVSMQH